jgi:hypothetical protein
MTGITVLVAVVSLLAGWGLAALLSAREHRAAEREFARLLGDRLARYRTDYARLDPPRSTSPDAARSTYRKAA